MPLVFTVILKIIQYHNITLHSTKIALNSLIIIYFIGYTNIDPINKTMINRIYSSSLSNYYFLSNPG